MDTAVRPRARAARRFNPLDYPLCLAEPRYLSGTSAWEEHIPFAFACVEMLRPRVLVELGTHKGDSYCAFCQAVDMLQLATKCYAVDTWKGDEHAGFYDDGVFEELKAYHDPLYGSFSRLIRSTFDEALDHFPDGSIDLLHIDGVHTYEAVRHDFEAWLPKMCARGVVLLHDTNIRERGFGVGKLWAELSGEYPAFEFAHGHGLGILAVGREPPSALLSLASADSRTAQLVRSTYFDLGRRSASVGEAERLRQELNTLAREDGERTAEITRLRAELAARDGRDGERTAEITRLRAELAARDGRLNELDGLLRAVRSKLAHQREKRKRSPLYRAKRTVKNAQRTLKRCFKEARRAVSERGWKTLNKALPSGRSSGDAMDNRALEQAKRTWRAASMVRLRAFLASSGRLQLPADAEPEISIVLVLHNQPELTFDCLQSIERHAGARPTEIIILDNNSTDLTHCLLDRLDGAKIVKSEINLHYLRGVNRAAREATGKYILLLNNDAQLMPGAIDAAIAAITSSDDVGAVGGRIVLPDGRLQEAGSIIWEDGTCAGFLRGCELTSSEAMYRRDVDYCSAVFLLTPRQLFEEMGGFDPNFAPAYYEETDYCVRLWRAGYRIVYEPDVVVLHYEFGSSSTSSEGTVLQHRNRKIFCARHATWLQHQCRRGDVSMSLAAVRIGDRKRVLYIEDRVPHDVFGAGYPRSRQIVRELVEAGAQLTFFPMFRHEESWANVRLTMGPLVEVVLGGSSEQLGAFLAARSGHFDAIIVSRPHNMRAFLRAIEQQRSVVGNAKLIYDAEAIFGQREIVKNEVFGRPLLEQEVIQLIEQEICLARSAHIVLSVSPREVGVFCQYGIGDVRLLGYTTEVTPTAQGFDERTEVLFVGRLHEEGLPNVDSLLWFVREVLPKFRRLIGSDLRLTVVGLTGAPSLAPLDGVDCEFLGQQADLEPIFARARIFIAPTRFAAGVPLKVYTSAAHGVPCVVTPLLAQQLGWEDGWELLVGSTAEEFAAACARLYRDRELWSVIREQSLARCGVECSRAAFSRTLRQLLDDIPRSGKAAPAGDARRGSEPQDYSAWITKYDTLSYRDRRMIVAQVAAMSDPPTISVVVPAYNTPAGILRRCIESVQRQLYPYWQLCIVDDASPEPHVAGICRHYAERDSRIIFKRRHSNGHIAAASNSALELASGEFVALLDHDDLLAPHALYMVAEAIVQNPKLTLIFTDEDKVDEDGRRFDPWFKTDWNYELMLSQNAVVHLAVFRRSILQEIGGFRSGLDGSQDYDLVLRFAERTSKECIAHLPFILYHWRAIPGSVALDEEQKTYPYEAARRAIEEHMLRISASAEVEKQAHRGYYRVRWDLPTDKPSVTIIIPMRDKHELLDRAIMSIRGLTTYRNYEIMIVDNGSKEADTMSYFQRLEADPALRLLTYEEAYNFAALNNWAVEHTDSEIVAFLNNDIEVISPQWLSEMVAHVLRDGVGAVGAKLYYPNDTIQHAGIVVGIGGLAGHLHVGAPRATVGYFGRAVCTQQFSAVTAACMVMKRSVFQGLGGFDEKHFKTAFGDVDLGLRLNQAGYKVIWTPHAELYRHEFASLGNHQSQEAKALFDQGCANLRRLWPTSIERDPFYNPNLATEGGNCALAYPPRVVRPWRSESANPPTKD